MKHLTRYALPVFVSYTKFLFFLFSIIIFNNQLAAQGTWTWKWGPLASTTLSASGLGVFSPANSPGERYAAVCWTDNTGKFWRYGGDAYADLWCYNPSINQWALMNGGFTSTPPSYGVMGIPSPTNTPGGASYGHPAWVDNNGNLWLYGINFSDDLWKYDITTNMWTWMKGTGGGAAVAVYGIQGTASSLNSPGQMGEIDCNWVDSNNNLWLYTHNDGILWKYDVFINMWTWVNGTAGGPLIYGTIGTFGATNSPSTFNGAPMVGTLFTMWKDKNDNLFMIANRVVGTSTNAEIWKFSITLNQWACMRTDASSSSVQTYASQCIETTTNFPIARTEMRMRWVDDCDNLWSFGGVEYFGFSTFYNDIWRYNSTSNNWVWVRGGIAPGTYGTMGVASSTNNPNPVAGSQRWTNKNGFWLAGGQNSTGSPSHHLWLYRPDTVIADFSFTTICPTTYFTDLSTSGCNNIKSHYWNFGDPASGTANIDSTSTNPSHTFSSSGTYSVNLIVKNCTWDADTIVKTVIVNCGLNTLLNSDTICLSDCINITAITTGGVPPYFYQWDNGITDTTAGPINICPTTTTSYQVITSDYVGDKDTTIATITVVPHPNINLSNDTVLCPGSSLLLDAGSPATIYLWSTGATTQIINANTSGTYCVTSANLQCSESDTINVEVLNQINWNAEQNLCESINFSLDAGVQNASYIWSTGETSQAIDITSEGTYWVVATKNNCVLTDTLTLTGTLGTSTLYIPNSFTPNNNGLNDVFSIKGESVTEFHLMIFNRWGEKIFECTNIDQPWDGKYKGRLVEQDVYVWKIQFKTECNSALTERIGHVTVVK